MIIKTAVAGITHLTQVTQTNTNAIKVVSNPATKSNSQLLISDCEHVNKIIAENVSGKSIQLNRWINFENSLLARGRSTTFSLNVMVRKAY